jgi:Flp pilus assembly protein CpaB
VLVHRRLLAAVLAALAVLAGIQAAAEPPGPTTAVVVARTDLAGGRVLSSADLTTAEVPVAAVPAGTVTSAVGLTGRLLAAPLRRGEPVTDVRLLAPGLLAGYPGLVAAPVRIADRASVRLLRVGDHVDLVATNPDGGTAATVASDAAVVAMPKDRGQDGSFSEGALVVVAVPRDRALALAQASVSAVVSVLLAR